jgi:heparin/heparan-sulfate lyase
MIHDHRFVASLLLTAVFLVPAAATPPPVVPTTWKEVDRVKIPVPPPERPRLYLRPVDVQQLPARLADPALQPVAARVRALAERSPQFRVEWDALQYLITRDRTLGRQTIAATLDLLKKAELPNVSDACRVTGRWMVTGAIVYDWVYDLLTRAEKDAFVAELVRLAKTQECGYPPTGQGSVTGHGSEAQIMRDMLSAGIAIYDEFPEMYDLAAGRFFREHLPARNWFYSGHAYHQGDSYGTYRYSADTFPLWIFDRLGAGNVYNPEQREVPYLFLYTARPDGQRLRAGDTYASSAPWGTPWGLGIGTVNTASYYGDGVLLSHHLQNGGVGNNEAIFELLWRDPKLQPEPIAALPLSRYFGSPFGWMVARTGWGEDAVLAEMKVNEYNFANHQHLDAGAFQIYYKGALAIDSGLYSGSSGAYGSPHCLNYYWRTIAHNALLIYNPAEQFGGKYGNDGGQRLPNGRGEPRTLEALQDPRNGYRTGEVLAHGFGPNAQTPDYTYLKGDITRAYSDKVRRVLRSFVFLNLRDAKVPAAMIVYDRVVAADPSFRKYWLLHTQEEPEVKGSEAVVACTSHEQRGRLTLDVLLPRPENLALSKVGGPGHEFWVFGQNYANDQPAERLARNSMEPGAWRVEISPKAASAEDLFLNVMQVTDRQTGGHFPVRRLDGEGIVGSVIEGPEAQWVVLFRRDGTPAQGPVQFTVPGAGACRVLVTDLAPGVWQARRQGTREPQTLTASGDQGAVWFAGQAGTWTLSRAER